MVIPNVTVLYLRASQGGTYRSNTSRTFFIKVARWSFTRAIAVMDLPMLEMDCPALNIDVMLRCSSSYTYVEPKQAQERRSRQCCRRERRGWTALVFFAEKCVISFVSVCATRVLVPLRSNTICAASKIGGTKRKRTGNVHV